MAFITKQEQNSERDGEMRWRDEERQNDGEMRGETE